VREQSSRRPHVYELDPLRALTALSVIAVHIVALTTFLSRSELSLEMQNAVVVALHFTRAVFIFVTAFALVYVYYGKPFSLKRFWGKRSISFLLPYIFWSLVYIPYNRPGLALAPVAFIKTAAFDILTGTASFQLYYILLSLQFYLFLPVFLLLLKRIARHPWIALSISLVIQVVVFYVDYHYLQETKLASTSKFWGLVSTYQDRFLFTYQFYFLLGAFTALYFQQVKAFLFRHGWVVVGGFVAILAGTWLHFVLQIRVFQLSLDDAGSVLQPMMVFYSAAVIFFMLWLACHWAARKGQDGRPGGYQFWNKLSDASFGVYLVHVFIMNFVLARVIPAMPASWHVSVRVFLAWALTAGVSFFAVVVMLHIPFVSRLFGRAHLQWKKVARPVTEEKSSESHLQAEEVNPVKLATPVKAENNIAIEHYRMKTNKEKQQEIIY
jgi:probable poly-beta-1,6-N-acetyl-D-glucosamine export protein